MKKILNWVTGGFLVVGGFFIGVLVRQPRINKLKKQIKILQKQLAALQDKMIGYQEAFDALLIQYKGLKVLQLKKRAECEGKLKDNLILQYGMKDYLTLLFDIVKNGRKLSKEEIVFFESFENVIEGKEISEKTFMKIKEFVITRHKNEIAALEHCNCSLEFQRIQEYRDA